MGSHRWISCRRYGYSKIFWCYETTYGKVFTRDFYIYGDPAGDQSTNRWITPFQILRGKGIHVRPAPSNDVLMRLESVNSVLSRMVDGESGILVDLNVVI